MSAARRLATPAAGILAGLTAAAALAVAAAPAQAAVEITAKPALRPAFERDTSDYVSRCPAGKPLRLSVRARDGDRVSVAGHKRRGGTFERSVSRKPDGAFTIRVDSGDETTTHHVRCLPKDFPEWSLTSRGPAQAQWYLIEPIGPTARGYIAFFDTNGVPVWWRHAASFGPWDGKLLPDGNVAYGRWVGDHFGVNNRVAWEVRRIDGKLLHVLRAVGNPTDTHDFQQLPNGNFLLITYRRRCCVNLSAYGAPAKAAVWDGEIQELRPNGKLVWRWSTKDHIPPSWTTHAGESNYGWWYQTISDTHNRPGSPESAAYDLVHLNSVEPDGDGLIVSARHIDSIFRIDRATGSIEWKLGGKMVMGKSLTVLNTPSGFGGERLFGGQHDARLWTDGTVTVHDNGSWRDRPPVMDRFRIDPIAHTATLLERISNPGIRISKAIGSTRKLAGGNWVTSWGGAPVVTEQTPDGAFVRAFAFADGRWSYRAVPIERGRLSASSLRRGMSKMVAARRK
ncbi:MAG TPA: aryl-sulfate sulfotransferase [Thermoleophilaceae bacterium]|nr:aryl-sulfate sulfotransferase [Thermoleophilaceae bacterium]